MPKQKEFVLWGVCDKEDGLYVRLFDFKEEAKMFIKEDYRYKKVFIIKKLICREE